MALLKLYGQSHPISTAASLPVIAMLATSQVESPAEEVVAEVRRRLKGLTIGYEFSHR